MSWRSSSRSVSIRFIFVIYLYPVHRCIPMYLRTDSELAVISDANAEGYKFGFLKFIMFPNFGLVNILSAE